MIRKATLEDSQFFIDLRNQPASRKYSLDQKEINLIDHENWYPNHYHDFGVICEGENPVGYLRLDPYKMISVCIQKNHWNKGHAFKTVSSLENQKMIAIIHKDNLASRRVFEKSGFYFLNDNFLTCVRS